MLQLPRQTSAASHFFVVVGIRSKGKDSSQDQGGSEQPVTLTREGMAAGLQCCMSPRQWGCRAVCPLGSGAAGLCVTQAAQGGQESPGSGYMVVLSAKYSTGFMGKFGEWQRFGISIYISTLSCVCAYSP